MMRMIMISFPYTHADDANDYDIVSVYGKGYMFTTVC